MPKANSDHYPETFVKTRGIIHYNFNIKEKQCKDVEGKDIEHKDVEGKDVEGKDVEGMSKIYYEYDYVVIKKDQSPEEIKDTVDQLRLSGLANFSYQQLENYIENNVVDLASAKVYLKKLSKVVLAILSNTRSAVEMSTIRNEDSEKV